MNKEEYDKKLSQLIAKCWSNETFKQKLIADPARTLKEEGVEIPAGLSVVALENSDTVYHLVIPPKPMELSEEDLENVTGGGSLPAGDPSRMCMQCMCVMRPPPK